MQDIRLIQGLLVVICISLICGITYTMVDINRHKVPAGMAMASGATTTAPAPKTSTPAPAPAAATASVVSMAPQGTWGIFYVNAQKVKASPMFKDAMKDVPAELQGAVADATDLALFVLPAAKDAEPGSASGCAVIRLGATGGAQVKQYLTQKGKAVTVGTTQAYAFEEPAPAAGAAPAGMPAPKGETTYVAMPDDRTVLAANSEAALTAILGTSKSGGAALDPKLADMVKPFSGAALYGAFIPPADMMQQVQMMLTMFAPPLASMTGVAFSVGLDSGVAITATLRMPAAADAQKAVTGVQAFVDDMKKQVAADPKAKAAAAALDKLKVSAENADVKLSIALTDAEIEALKALQPGGGPEMMEAPATGTMAPATAPAAPAP